MKISSGIWVLASLVCNSSKSPFLGIFQVAPPHRISKFTEVRNLNGQPKMMTIGAHWIVRAPSTDFLPHWIREYKVLEKSPNSKDFDHESKVFKDKSWLFLAIFALPRTHVLQPYSLAKAIASEPYNSKFNPPNTGQTIFLCFTNSLQLKEASHYIDHM